ncbi:MAG: hypothetical protein JKY52_10135 [Flavobacteriales bacterium]|nr:hypothetical protein [Flavobacteriales bacterium]
MKYRLVIIGVLILQLSCINQTDKKKPESKDSQTHSALTTSKSDSITNIESTNMEPQVGYKKYPSEFEYYKDVYSQEKLMPADDILMLSITDSLFTKNPENELFYFVVFTKSMIGSDGFYSEALGLSCYNFITTKSTKFATHFSSEPKLTEDDLNNWADYIFGEIQISRENEELEAIMELEAQLIDDIKASKIEYKELIERLIAKIKTSHNRTFK